MVSARNPRVPIRYEVSAGTIQLNRHSRPQASAIPPAASARMPTTRFTGPVCLHRPNQRDR